MSSFKMVEGQSIEYNGERIVFYADDFVDINTATLTEIVTAINSRAITFTAVEDEGELSIIPNDGEEYNETSLIQKVKPDSVRAWDGIKWHTK